MSFHNFVTYLIKIAFLGLVVTSFTANAQDQQIESINLRPESLNMNKEFKILLPSNEYNFLPTLQKRGLHNGINVTLYRYQPEGKFVLDQQHVSILQSDKGNLEGFVRLLPQYKISGRQISKDRAKTIAINFLQRFAPDLLDKFKVNWIDEHTEEIYVNNEKIIISGMKVKCRNEKDGLYFWVVIAPDESVMIFERDVEWDFLRAGRKTEKWLHDSWLVKNM